MAGRAKRARSRTRVGPMPILITIVGPIASGKNTTADLIAQRCVAAGRAVVIADVDDVAHMVSPGDRQGSLWLAAHRAHGALVGEWMRSEVDVVIAVGPIYDQDEQAALYGQIPADARLCRVLIDAPLATTWSRVANDRQRGASRDMTFHKTAHARYRSLMAGIPADFTFDSSTTSAADIAAAVADAAGITANRS